MRYKLFLVLLALAVSPAYAKSLHWRALDVAANLDRDGRLAPSAGESAETAQAGNNGAA